MLEKFIPDIFEKTVYNIDFYKYYEKGYRGILFDIDNTLVLHNAPCDERCLQLINNIKKIGFKILVLSNNKENRVKSFCDDLDILYISNAKKPKVDNFLRAIKILHLRKNECLFVGDQLFTDIYGAKKSNIKCILVKPLGSEIYLKIKLKRVFEKVVLFLYFKGCKKYA